MKSYHHTTAVLLILLLIGLLLGSIIGDILGNIGVPYIHESKELRWSPAGNFIVIVWDFDLLVRVNLASVLGLVLAFLIFRKL